MTSLVIPQEVKQCVISIVILDFFISDLDMDEKYLVYNFLAALSQTSVFLGFFMIIFFSPLIFTYTQYLGV